MKFRQLLTSGYLLLTLYCRCPTYLNKPEAFNPSSKRIKYEQQIIISLTDIWHFFFKYQASFGSWLLLLASTKKSLEIVSNFVCHATFSGIILLHKSFSINLFYDLMNKFFKEYL